MATNNSVDVGLSGSTGTGNFVGANSPALITPALGTPASGVLTNCTGLTSSGVAANSGAGIPVQVVQGQLTSTTSIASATPITSGVTASITPTASTSQILVRAVINFGINVGDVGFLQLQRGATIIGVGATAGSRTSCAASNAVASGQELGNFTLEWLDNPATTSSTTYAVYVWTSSGNQSYVNRSVTDTNSAGFPRCASTITLMEIK